MASSNERAILAGGCFWGMQDLLRRYAPAAVGVVVMDAHILHYPLY
jgi:peptide methionine sulfoxide reductase MsrA